MSKPVFNDHTDRLLSIKEVAQFRTIIVDLKGTEKMNKTVNPNNAQIAIRQIAALLATNGILLSEVDVIFSEVKKVIQNTPVGGKYIRPTSEQREKLLELLKESFRDIR